MSATERLKVWLNQQLANILGDLPEREPVEDPSPMRAGCRIFFMLSLLVGFLLLLGYTFIDAPDARVVQIHHVTREGKNHAFPGCILYDRNSTNCTKWSKAKFPEGIPVSCPCTNTTAPWKDFVKFHILYQNSTDRNMSFTIGEILSDDFPSLGNEGVLRGNRTLTVENFCDLSYLWNTTTNKTRTGVAEDDPIHVTANDSLLYQNCVWMASLLFPSPNDTSLLFSEPKDFFPSGLPSKYFGDRTRSTRFLNTPSLLSREEFNTLLAKLARESVLSRRLTLDMALSLILDNKYYRRSYNAVAHLLIGLLDRKEMDPSESYNYGAQELHDTLISNLFLTKESKVWCLRNDSGLIFLQPEIDWEAYRETCSPVYCEVIKPMGGARKLYRAFGILGGVATIVLAVVTTLLWPCTATLLLWISKRNAVAPRDPERPSGPLFPLAIEL